MSKKRALALTSRWWVTSSNPF